MDIRKKTSSLKGWSGAGTVSPGKWWCNHPWKHSKVVWLWHLGAGFSAELCSPGLKLSLSNLELFSNLNNSVIIQLRAAIALPERKSFLKVSQSLLIQFERYFLSHLVQIDSLCSLFFCLNLLDFQTQQMLRVLKRTATDVKFEFANMNLWTFMPLQSEKNDVSCDF